MKVDDDLVRDYIGYERQAGQLRISLLPRTVSIAHYSGIRYNSNLKV